MRHGRISAGVAAVLAAAFAGACSKQEAPPADPATERAEANKRARQDVFGTQVRAMDDAKKLPDDLNKKAQENLDKVDSMSK